jgi:HEAT repeat protein
LFTAMNLLWSHQRRYEQEEIMRWLRQIASGDAPVREQALEGIRGLGPYAAPPIVAALGSKDLSTRRAAALASGEVLAICQRELGAMNCVTGFVTGRGAAQSGFERLQAALIQILIGEDRTLRLDAVRAFSGLTDDRREATDPMSQRIGAVLREELKLEGNPEARKEMIRLLGRSRPTLDRERASALADALGDPDATVRQAALQTLTESLARWGSSKEKATRATLRAVAPEILGEARDRKDTAALIALGSLGEPGAVGALVEFVQGPDMALRSHAAAALWRLGGLMFQAEAVSDEVSEALRASLSTLIASLGDTSDDVRRHAAHALSSMREASVEAIPALEKAAERERVGHVRAAMTEACRSIRLSAEIARRRAGAAPAERGNAKP